MARGQSLRPSAYRWMAGGQADRAAASRAWKCRHPVERTGRRSLAWRRIRRLAIRTMRGVRSRAALHHPLTVLLVKHIFHVHSRAGRAASLGLEMHLSRRFVPTKTDRRHAHVHGEQIGTLPEIGQDALAHGVLVLDVFLAAAKQNDAQAGSRDADGAFHISIIAERRSVHRIGSSGACAVH